MTPTMPVPIIIISRQKETDAVIGGLRTGAVDYIRKPFDGDEVRTLLHALAVWPECATPLTANRSPPRCLQALCALF